MTKAAARQGAAAGLFAGTGAPAAFPSLCQALRGGASCLLARPGAAAAPARTPDANDLAGAAPAKPAFKNQFSRGDEGRLRAAGA